MSELQTSKTGTSRPEGWWVAGGGSLTLMTSNPAVGPGPFRLSLHLKLISGFLIVLGLAVTIGAARHMLDGEWMAGLSRSRGIPTPLLFLLGLFLMAAPWLISAQEQKSWGKLHPILSLDSDGVNVRTFGVVLPGALGGDCFISRHQRQEAPPESPQRGADGSGEELSRRHGPRTVGSARDRTRGVLRSRIGSRGARVLPPERGSAVRAGDRPGCAPREPVQVRGVHCLRRCPDPCAARWHRRG